MRKLEFRFWDIKGQRWEDNFGIYADGVIGDFSECFHNSAGENGEYYIAQQFTGLLDFQGKEIYEGDLVKDKDGYIIQVRWNSESAGFVPFIDPAYSYLDLFEIVGNIFQNPELLNQ